MKKDAVIVRGGGLSVFILRPFPFVGRPVPSMDVHGPSRRSGTYRELQGTIATSRRQERTLRGALASRDAPDCRNRSMKDLGLHLGLTEPLEAHGASRPPSWAFEEIANSQGSLLVACGRDGGAWLREAAFPTSPATGSAALCRSRLGTNLNSSQAPVPRVMSFVCLRNPDRSAGFSSQFIHGPMPKRGAGQWWKKPKEQI
ncbi:hypothetical protein L209DRAFT_755354 [Thermothelomyces heterothallicus CBS 203.75]